MSKTNFTPGPWEAEHSTPSYWITADSSDLAVIISACPQTRQTLPAEANARLMAASPALYASTDGLRHLVRCMATGPGWTQELMDDILAAADAAIAQVEG